jgi:hypothetical protein
MVGELGEVDIGAVALDHLLLLQVAVPGMAGAGREADLGGELQVAHPAFGLQRHQDLHVHPVDLLGLGHLPHASPAPAPGLSPSRQMAYTARLHRNSTIQARR